MAGPVPPEASPGHADGRLLPMSSRGHPSMCVCLLTSSSDKDTSHIGVEPTLETSFYLNDLFKTPLQIQTHSEVPGIGTSPLGFGRHCPTCDSASGQWGERIRQHMPSAKMKERKEEIELRRYTLGEYWTKDCFLL